MRVGLTMAMHEDLSPFVHKIEELSHKTHMLATALNDAAPLRPIASTSVPFLMEMSLELKKLYKNCDECVARVHINRNP